MSKFIKTEVSDNTHKTLVAEADKIGLKRERFYGNILYMEAARIAARNAKKGTSDKAAE